MDKRKEKRVCMVMVVMVGGGSGGEGVTHIPYSLQTFPYISHVSTSSFRVYHTTRVIYVRVTPTTNMKYKNCEVGKRRRGGGGGGGVRRQGKGYTRLGCGGGCIQSEAGSVI